MSQKKNVSPERIKSNLEKIGWIPLYDKGVVIVYTNGDKKISMNKFLHITNIKYANLLIRAKQLNKEIGCKQKKNIVSYSSTEPSKKESFFTEGTWEALGVMGYFVLIIATLYIWGNGPF